VIITAALRLQGRRSSERMRYGRSCGVGGGGDSSWSLGSVFVRLYRSLGRTRCGGGGFSPTGKGLRGSTSPAGVTSPSRLRRAFRRCAVRAGARGRARARTTAGGLAPCCPTTGLPSWLGAGLLVVRLVSGFQTAGRGAAQRRAKLLPPVLAVSGNTLLARQMHASSFLVPGSPRRGKHLDAIGRGDCDHSSAASASTPAGGFHKGPDLRDAPWGALARRSPSYALRRSGGRGTRSTRTLEPSLAGAWAAR